MDHWAKFRQKWRGQIDKKNLLGCFQFLNLIFTFKRLVFYCLDLKLIFLSALISNFRGSGPQFGWALTFSPHHPLPPFSDIRHCQVSIVVTILIQLWDPRGTVSQPRSAATRFFCVKGCRHEPRGPIVCNRCYRATVNESTAPDQFMLINPNFTPFHRLITD